MIDLGISAIAYLLLPVSTLLNVVLLFPVPQFLKKRIRAAVASLLLPAFLFSVAIFVFYAYSYSNQSFDLSEHDPVVYRLEARSKQWKMERNYHITFFNLVNWMVCTGTERLLAKLDAKKEKEKEKKKE